MTLLFWSSFSKKLFYHYPFLSFIDLKGLPSTQTPQTRLIYLSSLIDCSEVSAKLSTTFCCVYFKFGQQYEQKSIRGMLRLLGPRFLLFRNKWGTAKKSSKSEQSCNTESYNRKDRRILPWLRHSANWQWFRGLPLPLQDVPESFSDQTRNHLCM